MKYRKKPVVVDAVQWNGENYTEVLAMTNTEGGIATLDGETLFVDTPGGCVTANLGDFIIKGVKGEIYPCELDIFAETYEEVSG